jgi:hypothetical protein
MKIKTAITAFAFAGVFQLVAAQPPSQPALAKTTAEKNQGMSANVAVAKHQFQVTTPFSKLTPKRTEKIERYGSMSSRPWTQIAGWHPGAPLWTYEDGENQEPQLVLLQVRW